MPSQYYGGPDYSIPSKHIATTTPLTAGATFTSLVEANGYPQLTLECDSDVDGTLYVDFRRDDTATWRTLTFAVSGGSRLYRRLNKNGRQVRVRFTCGSDAQSAFELFGYFEPFGVESAPGVLSIQRNAGAIVVRDLAPAQDEIVIDKRAGVDFWEKFAYRSDLDQADGDGLITADNTTNTPTILTTASTFTIAYTQADDGSAAEGAKELTFFYVDGNGNSQVAAHTLGSDGSDVTSFSGLGINRVAVSASGTNDTNVSDIVITATTGGSVQAFIPAGSGVTQQAIFYNDSNADGVTLGLDLNAIKLSGSSPKITIKGWIYNRGIDTLFEVFRCTIDTAVENNVIKQFKTKLNATDVLYFTASTTADNANIAIRFALNGYEKT